MEKPLDHDPLDFPRCKSAQLERRASDARTEIARRALSMIEAATCLPADYVDAYAAGNCLVSVTEGGEFKMTPIPAEKMWAAEDFTITETAEEG